MRGLIKSSRICPAKITLKQAGPCLLRAKQDRRHPGLLGGRERGVQVVRDKADRVKGKVKKSDIKV